MFFGQKVECRPVVQNIIGSGLRPGRGVGNSNAPCQRVRRAGLGGSNAARTDRGTVTVAKSCSIK